MLQESELMGLSGYLIASTGSGPGNGRPKPGLDRTKIFPKTVTPRPFQRSRCVTVVERTWQLPEDSDGPADFS